MTNLIREDNFVSVQRVQQPRNRKRPYISKNYAKKIVAAKSPVILEPVVKSSLVPGPDLTLQIWDLIENS